MCWGVGGGEERCGEVRRSVLGREERCGERCAEGVE